MPLYAFNPLVIPAPFPSAPGTDFQDFVNANMPGVDGADTAMSAAIALMSAQQGPDYADVVSLGLDIADSFSTLADMITADAADDLTTYILAATDQDSSLASLANDVLTGLSLIPTSILNVLIGDFAGLIDSAASQIVNSAISGIYGELSQLEDQVMQLSEFRAD